MRHKFYIPIGMPTFSGPPTTAPVLGDTYFDKDPNILSIRTWDGTKWVKGSGTLTAGPGLYGGGSMADDITMQVDAGAGLKFDSTGKLTVDTTNLDGRYVNTTGDTMSGPLVLPSDPTIDPQAATKRYVDVKSAAVNAYQVVAGAGLTGGGLIRYSPTFNIGQGWGITVAADQIAVNQATLNAAYAVNGHGHSYAAVNHTHPLIGHTHTYSQVGIWASSVSIGSMAGGKWDYRRFTHNLKKTIRAATVTAWGDSGTNVSLACSIRESMNPSAAASNTWIEAMIQNTGSATEAGVGMSIILIY